jgi:HlyD family secretion protein
MAEKKNGGGLVWVMVLILLGGLAAGGYYYFRHGQVTVPEYQAVTVDRGDVTQVVTATGILNPVKNVQVGCQVSGRISALYVDYNSQVKQGEVIAEIDPATYVAAQQQAEADLANSKANLELQDVEARRASNLFTNQLISESDYDTAVATLHEAQATVKIKEATLANAVANLGYCKILSPVDGVVISRAVDVGQTVASSFSTPTLFQIANDLTKMQIDTSIAEADIGNIAEGQNVDFLVDAYPYRTFHGSVTQVRNSPITSNNVVTYDTVIGVTNADYKLKPGMTATVSIVVNQRTNTLRLANSALRFRPVEAVLTATNKTSAGTPATNGNAVGQRNGNGNGGGGARKHAGSPDLHTVYLLAADQNLQPVQIRTGISDGIYTEVVDGLKEGDAVVNSSAGVEAQPVAGGSNPFGGGFGGGRR